MTTKWMPLIGTGLAVRIDWLSETQASKNHGQTLLQLATRGGLSCEEALALAEHRNWSARRGELDSLKALALMGSNVEVTGDERASPAKRPCGLPGST